MEKRWNRSLAEYDAAVLAYVAEHGEWPQEKSGPEWKKWRIWLGKRKLGFRRRQYELGRPRAAKHRAKGTPVGRRASHRIASVDEVEAKVLAYRQKTGRWPSVDSGKEWRAVSYWLATRVGKTLAAWRTERFGATAKVLTDARRLPKVEPVAAPPKAGPDLTSWRATMGPLGGKRGV